MQDKSRYNHYLSHYRDCVGNVRMEPEDITDALYAAYCAGRCAEIAEQCFPNDKQLKAQADHMLNTLLNTAW